jgi:putative FmdB family regulatory protein
MPIYCFECPKDGTELEDLRKMGDFEPPKCPTCQEIMERRMGLTHTVLKGEGWGKGTWAKAKERSVNQGQKFFKGHPKLQEMSKTHAYPTQTGSN